MNLGLKLSAAYSRVSFRIALFFSVYHFFINCGQLPCSYLGKKIPTPWCYHYHVSEGRCEFREIDSVWFLSNFLCSKGLIVILSQLNFTRAAVLCSSTRDAIGLLLTLDQGCQKCSQKAIYDPWTDFVRPLTIFFNLYLIFMDLRRKICCSIHRFVSLLLLLYC